MRKKYKLILADLDGTVNRGGALIPGALDVYARTVARGIRWCFLTNNASRMDFEIADTLRNWGFDTSPETVINSATALCEEIKKFGPGRGFYVIGEPTFREGIERVGGVVFDTPDPAVQGVITALDRGMTYEKIKNAHICIQRGAFFWATNLDATYPVESGFHPGAGSIAAAVAVAAGRQPDRVFGKPSPEMAFIAMRRTGAAPSECLVVGDRIETDIYFAHNAGLDSALTLTGASGRDEVDALARKPTHVIESIADLDDLL